MESHNQDEPLKTITEWLSKRELFNQVFELLDNNRSNDEIENVFKDGGELSEDGGELSEDGGELSEVLKGALEKDPDSIDECLKAIDLVDIDKLSGNTRKSLINLRKQLVILKERIAEENREWAEESSEENSEWTENTSEQ
jgi:hypothetical protein